MHARISQLLVTCGCFTLLAAGGCKSDSPLTPNDSLNPIPNPSGPVNVGDVVSLNVNGNDPCTNAVYHGARVVAISNKAIILADTLNPKNGFTTADYQRFATRFDTLVYPLDVANFGEPLDIDKNGHIGILFTRAVNELTPPKSNSYVGGFVFSRDLFPVTGTPRAQACAASNQGEYFYMLAPDPTGVVNGNVRTTGFVDSATVPVLAHEFQHLINATRRLYVNNSPAFEEKWLDEGLAHIAEELLFYRESGLVPRANIDISAVRSSSLTRLSFATDMGGNLSRYRSYLGATATNSPYAINDSLPTRGATWSLLRYAVDRANATDAFAPGNGQSVTGSGFVGLAPGTTAGEYSIILVNTSLQGGTSASYAVTSTSGAADVIALGCRRPSNGADAAACAPARTIVASTVPVAASDDPNSLRLDTDFEARLRSRERAALTPLMGAARSWYKSQSMPAPAVLQSRSAYASTSFAEADAATWFRLVNSTTVGFTNLQSVVGSDMAGFIRDWQVSHAVDDVAAPSTQYQQRSWNWHSIYPNITNPSTAYPLQNPLITGVVDLNGTIVAGGALYFRVSVPANGTTTLNLNAPVGAANPNLQLVAVRTK